MSIYMYEDPDKDVAAWLGRGGNRVIYPICQICHEEILEEKCYVMNEYLEFDNCICPVCGRHELFKANKSLDTTFANYLEGYMDERLTFTPTEERDI